MKRPDPLRRFTSTPFATLLPVMGRTIRLETNDDRMLERIAAVFAGYPSSQFGRPDFLWRIVSQPNLEVRDPWPPRSAFSGANVRFAQFGQTNFVAVDLKKREAIGYIAEGLAENELELTSPFLDTLFCLTAGSLGLTSMFSACVGISGTALLVFGAPDNGKTSASYLAAKTGLEFHADRAVFLEVRSGRLFAWGDFWPAVFRPDALNYYAELQASTRLFRYHDFSSYYLDKRQYQMVPLRAVTPVCCVFLERRPGGMVSPSRITRTEFSKRLEGLESFEDDARFDAQRAAVFRVLEALPAFDLVHEDPAAAAKFFRVLLKEHSSRDARLG
jgi:hypothetical protein